MRFLHTFQRNIFIVFFVVSLTIVYAAYLAVGNIVAEQSRIQQQSIAPVFTLVIEELIKPLYQAQALAKDQYLIERLNSADIDESQLLSYLENREVGSELTYFIASEKARRQFQRNKPSFELDDNVAWYNKLKSTQQPINAALGNTQEPHLYIDVRLTNAQNEFLGFVGVGKTLNHFWQRFATHKRTYGYDLYFVDQHQHVLLTTDDAIRPDQHELQTLDAQDWYQQALLKGYDKASLNSVLVTLDDEDFLISEIALDVLGWKIYLLSPLEARQAALTQNLVFNLASVVLIALLLFVCAYYLLKHFSHSVEKNMHKDALSGLFNRHYIDKSFAQITQQGCELSLLLIDVDHFKQINDQYGHNTGDAVIQSLARLLETSIREQDRLARWGGEEFILLLPWTGANEARAIAERIRFNIAGTPISHRSHRLAVSASIGISYSPTPDSLDQLVEYADQALYQAKAMGRNRVILHQK